MKTNIPYSTRLAVDVEHDVAYLSIGPEMRGLLRAHRSQPTQNIIAGGDVVLDFDVEGRLIGIEFLQASKQLPKGVLP